MSNSLSPAAAVRRWLPDVLLVAFAAAITIFAAQFITSDNFWLDEFFSIEMVSRSWAEIPAALPETGGSLFLIFPEEDPAGDWAAALEGAGLQPDSWQGALLNNQWCRIYHYVPAA